MALRESWHNDGAGEKATKGVATALETVDTVVKVVNSPIVEGLGAFGKWIGKVANKKTNEEAQKLKKRAEQLKKTIALLGIKQKQEAQEELNKIAVIQKQNEEKQKQQTIKVIGISSVVLLVGIGIAVIIHKKTSQQQ